jgi:hypothetical protein
LVEEYSHSYLSDGSILSKYIIHFFSCYFVRKISVFKPKEISKYQGTKRALSRELYEDRTGIVIIFEKARFSREILLKSLSKLSEKVTL